MGTKPKILEPVCEIIGTDRRDASCCWLSEFSENEFSQNGEDGIIKKIFEVIGTKNKLVVDFGAGDGISLSNSRALIKNDGWSGVLIEPGPSFQRLQHLYKKNDKVHTLEKFIGLEGNTLLDNILTEVEDKVPVDFDFLSIDVDSCDLHILHSLKNFNPRVVCIEFNQFLGNNVYFIQKPDFSVNQGSSLLAIQLVAKTLGYELIATSSSNAFLVQADLYHNFEIPSNNIDHMFFNENQETKLLIMPSGELRLAGMTKHPWKGFVIEESRLQVLPSNMQQWKFDGHLWPKNKLS